MSIQVNGNAGAINWDALLNKLGEVTKTEGADGVAGSTNVTITTTVDGVETPVTIRIPDDLEIPETVDQAAIDSLCEKLAADTGLNLSEEQIKLFHDSLTKTLTETLDAMPKSSAQSAMKRAMFDLYKMMALLVEVAQKQRDATREMRLSENLSIQNSILNQAAAQRQAAVTGMIGGAICCALQVGATFIALYQQGKAFKTQLGTEQSTGLDVASKNVDMIKAANNQDNATKQLNKVQAEIGGKPSIDGHGTVRGHVENSFSNQQFNEAQTKFVDARNAMQTKTELYATVGSLGSEGNINQVTSETLAPLEGRELTPVKAAVAKLDTAKANFNDAKAQLTAKLNEVPNLSQEDKQFIIDKSSVPFNELSMADRTKLMSIKSQHMSISNLDMRGAVSDLAQAKAEVKTAFDNAVADLRGQIAPDGQLQTQLDTAKENYRAQIKLEMQKFEDSYDAALKDFNEVSKNGTKAEIEAARAKLEKAGNELTYARALGNSKLMKPELTDAKTHLADVESARGKYLSAQQARANSVDYIKASNTITEAQAYNSLIAAIGSFGQNFIQSWAQLVQADATKLGAEQKKSEEELDQTKDLFSQAEQLVNNVVQLMNAVRQAEAQSMRDAIQA